MSVKIMSAIFDSETLGPTERLIMLSLADHADDNGRCYPSIARLCQRTGLKERAVQTNIRTLSAAGYITIIPGGGKGRPNLYFVRANPAADAPRSKCTPAYDDIQTPHMTTSNPAGDAPEPSGTIIEPSEPIGSSSSGADGDRKSAEVQRAFEAYNAAAAQSGWPMAQVLSKSRRSGIAARLRECGGLTGWHAALAKAQASPMCCGQNSRGWVANLDFIIQPKSFTRLMEGTYDNRIAARPQQSSHRPQNGPDAALDQIARVAGLG
ncbi:helix-turn-helix domain-containing protein [Ketogulonicigenium vulgare]|uniref:helix-turn-helix domain-containing protein n=1 Tax=Ketogulonicigenium vulgare TaxID=92945 RepID=UPI002359D91F|nr:helix-turn-helix domain-containing protein [Ketogulonicigenium vulgare]